MSDIPQGIWMQLLYIATAFYDKSHINIGIF